MRLNSEQDRVNKFKSIALQETQSYYSVLEQFTQLLDELKEAADQTHDSTAVISTQRIEFKQIH